MLYINKIEEKSFCGNIKSFAPTIRSPIAHSVLGDVKRKLLHRHGMRVEPLPDEEFVDRAICSGNVINLNAWEVLGGFLEELFIDDTFY